MSNHPHLSASIDPTLTAKSRSTWEIVRRVSVYLLPYRWMALGNMLCAILTTDRQHKIIWSLAGRDLGCGRVNQLGNIRRKRSELEVCASGGLLHKSIYSYIKFKQVSLL